MKGAYLGPEFSDSEIETELIACGAKFKNNISENDLIDEIAEAMLS